MYYENKISITMCDVSKGGGGGGEYDVSHGYRTFLSWIYDVSHG